MKEIILKPDIYSNFKMLTELSNLRRVWLKVRQSKSLRPRFIKFNEKLMHYLAIIQSQLRNDSFEFGPYEFFKVKEKKMRSIANAPLKDRVVHWILYERLVMQWEKRFIHDTYGNLPRKGTHAAVKRLSDWARKPSLAHALQIDIAKYFSSVNHSYLKKNILRYEGDQKIRELLINLVDSYHTGTAFDDLFNEETPYRNEINKGMPLGNLTSQIFANIYLNEFDHWIKEELKLKYYIRYVDDLVVLGTSVAELQNIKEILLKKLLTYGLTVNPKKISITKTDAGISFLGYIVWPNHISAGKYVRKRISSVLKKSNGKDIKQTLAAYNGIFTHTGATR
jgi:retron-type reverse transcriptase